MFNEAEASADPETEEAFFEEIHSSSYKREKRAGKKEEDLQASKSAELLNTG